MRHAFAAEKLRRPQARPGVETQVPADTERAMSNGLFLVTRTRGKRWNPERSLEEQEYWKEHAEFMDDLHRRGIVVLGGPISGTPDVLLIVRAGNEAQIEQCLEKDPWVDIQLLRTLKIQPWELRLGSVS